MQVSSPAFSISAAVVSGKRYGDEVEGVCGLDRSAISVCDCRTESLVQILWSRGRLTQIQFLDIVIYFGNLYRLGRGWHSRSLGIAN